MGFILYLLYGVLVLNLNLEGSDPELFLSVWDFGKSWFDGADPTSSSKNAFGNSSSRYDVPIDSLEKLQGDRA